MERRATYRRNALGDIAISVDPILDVLGTPKSMTAAVVLVIRLAARFAVAFVAHVVAASTRQRNALARIAAPVCPALDRFAVATRRTFGFSWVTWHADAVGAHGLCRIRAVVTCVAFHLDDNPALTVLLVVIAAADDAKERCTH